MIHHVDIVWIECGELLFPILYLQKDLRLNILYSTVYSRGSQIPQEFGNHYKLLQGRGEGSNVIKKIVGGHLGGLGLQTSLEDFPHPLTVKKWPFLVL